MASALQFCQRTELGGVALKSNVDEPCAARVEYDGYDGMTHRMESVVDPKGYINVPMSRECRLVNREGRAVVTFVPWQFNLATATADKEFVIQYAQGPVAPKLKVLFYPAVTHRASIDYSDPVECGDVGEWVPGRSYTLVPNINANVTQGKFVMSTEDGLYESMIPWVQPTLKNPTYAMTQVVTPLVAQTVLAALVHQLVKGANGASHSGDTSLPDGSRASAPNAGGAILQTLLASIVAMHGPAMAQELSKGVSPAASAVLPRPGDHTPADGWRRLAKNPEVWRRVISSVVGTAFFRKPQ